MKNNFYVLRQFRNGQNPAGYDFGKPQRFATLFDAEENAARFAQRVLHDFSYDKIVVGSGSVRNGQPVGDGQRLAVYCILDGDTVITRRQAA